jgi:hypothetical protein
MEFEQKQTRFVAIKVILLLAVVFSCGVAAARSFYGRDAVAAVPAQTIVASQNQTGGVTAQTVTSAASEPAATAPVAPKGLSLVKTDVAVPKADLADLRRAAVTLTRQIATLDEERLAWSEKDPTMKEIEREVDKLRELNRAGEKVRTSWEKSNPTFAEVQSTRQKIAKVLARVGTPTKLRAECFTDQSGMSDDTLRRCANGHDVWSISSDGVIMKVTAGSD